MKVHKVIQGSFYWVSICGQSTDTSIRFQLRSPRWKNVTCKKCLKKKNNP